MSLLDNRNKLISIADQDGWDVENFEADPLTKNDEEEEKLCVVHKEAERSREKLNRKNSLRSKVGSQYKSQSTSSKSGSSEAYELYVQKKFEEEGLDYATETKAVESPSVQARNSSCQELTSTSQSSTPEQQLPRSEAAGENQPPLNSLNVEDSSLPSQEADDNITIQSLNLKRNLMTIYT
ncbi:hypothetical protein ACROYT_G014583 [Oculina patagonica]